MTTTLEKISNNKMKDGTDNYILLVTSPKKDGRALIPLNKNVEAFYKTVIEGKNHRINHWFIK